MGSKNSYCLLSISRRHKVKAIQAPPISNKLKVKSKGPILEVVGDSRIVLVDDEKDCIIIEVGGYKSEEDLEIVL